MIQKVGSPNWIATYISHSVRRGLHNGQVIAVPFDDPVLQGRLGVRAALNAMRGETLSMMEVPTIQLIKGNKPELLELPPVSGRFGFRH